MKHPRTVLIVQMRLDSSRLPRKALLPLAGTTLAGAVMRRLRGVRADEYVLASDSDGVAELEPIARGNSFSVFAGPKDDVLARYAQAAQAYGAEMIVRATGDNPLVSCALANDILERALAVEADYAGFLGMPVGMGVEVIRAEALRKAQAEAGSPYEREHVCPYLYGHPELFSVLRPECPASYRSSSRVTVDTDADYSFIRELFAKLGDEPDDGEILAYLGGNGLKP